MKRRRLSLGWIDFLVIAASILTFAAVAGATIAQDLLHLLAGAPRRARDTCLSIPDPID